MDEAFRNLQRRNDPVAQLLYKERMGLVSKTFIQAAAILGDSVAEELYPDLWREQGVPGLGVALRNLKCFEWVLSEGTLEEAKRLFSAIWFSEVENKLNYLTQKYNDRHLQAWNHFEKLKTWLQTDLTNSRTMQAIFDSNSRYLDLISQLITEEDVYSRDVLSVFNSSVSRYCCTYNLESPYDNLRDSDDNGSKWGRRQANIDLGDSATSLLACFELNNGPACNEYAATEKAFERCMNLRLLEWFQGFLL